MNAPESWLAGFPLFQPEDHAVIRFLTGILSVFPTVATDGRCFTCPSIVEVPQSLSAILVLRTVALYNNNRHVKISLIGLAVAITGLDIVRSTCALAADLAVLITHIVYFNLACFDPIFSCQV